MFHVAYFIGSLISTRVILTQEIVMHEHDLADPNDILW